MNLKAVGHAFATLLALAAAAQACADDAGPALRLGGFGTLGATYHTRDDVDYRRSLDQTHGTRGGEIDLCVDSVLGIQLNARANEQLEAVVQAVSRRYVDDTWKPRLTWAFLRYAPDESAQLRIGRLGLDTQLNADSRLIGFSYLPVRPSPEYLGMIPIDFTDGADLSLRHPMGGGLATAKLFYGREHGEISAAGRASRISDSTGGGLVLGYTLGGLQLRAVSGTVRLTDNGDMQALIDGLRATGLPSAANAAARLDNRGRRLDFHALDAAYESGPLKLQGSLFSQRASGEAALLANMRAGFVVAGYRLGEFTPYASFARVKSERVDFATGLPAFPRLIELDQAANGAVRGAQFDQRSVGLGVRYDFATNYALKFQVERVRAGDSPLVRDLGPRPRDVKRLTLFSLALDFVF